MRTGTHHNLTPTLLGLLVIQAVAAGATEIPRWQPHDLSFKSTTPHENPFKVDFSAEVIGPDGIRFNQLGFYDGDNTWKIRLGPNTPGK